VAVREARTPQAFDYLHLSDDEKALGADRDPVLFVGGFSGSADSYMMPVRMLRAHGYDVTGFHQSLHGFRSLQVQAADLGKAIDNVRARTGSGKVQIVAHSCGVPTVMHYLNAHGGASTVSQVVGLAGPLELARAGASQSEFLERIGRQVRRFGSPDSRSVMHELYHTSSFAQRVSDRSALRAALSHGSADLRWTSISNNRGERNGVTGDGLIPLRASVVNETSTTRDGERWFHNIVLHKPDSTHQQIGGGGLRPSDQMAWDPDARRAVVSLLAGKHPDEVTAELRPVLDPAYH
jgi:hypothetical protein